MNARCRLPDRCLFLGRARLFPEWIRVTGWTWTGRYDRQIPLAEMRSVAWFAGPGRQNGLVFEMRDDSRIPLLLNGSLLWKFALERHLQQKRSFTVNRLFEIRRTGDEIRTMRPDRGPSGDGRAAPGAPVIRRIAGNG